MERERIAPVIPAALVSPACSPRPLILSWRRVLRVRPGQCWAGVRGPQPSAGVFTVVVVFSEDAVLRQTQWRQEKR